MAAIEDAGVFLARIGRKFLLTHSLAYGRLQLIISVLPSLAHTMLSPSAHSLTFDSSVPTKADRAMPSASESGQVLLTSLAVLHMGPRWLTSQKHIRVDRSSQILLAVDVSNAPFRCCNKLDRLTSSACAFTVVLADSQPNSISHRVSMRHTTGRQHISSLTCPEHPPGAGTCLVRSRHISPADVNRSHAVARPAFSLDQLCRLSSLYEPEKATSLIQWRLAP
jgi:hypothetical protein